MSVSTLPETADAAADGGTKGGRKKKLVIVVLALVLVAGAAYFFLLRKPADTEPVAGEVLVMEPIQVNLAAGHYLRIGVALQLTADAHEADGSKALDAVIDMFSGQRVGDLTATETRAKMKEELLVHLEEDYHGEVMDVYFTEFVTQ